VTDTGEVLIRRLSADEIDVFRCIRLEALSAEPASFASTFEDWANLPDEEWRRRLSRPIFIALLDGQAIGMMGLSHQRPAKIAHRAVLTSVYLRKTERGSGIADDLFRAVSTYARSAGILLLELMVSAENDAALRFYRRHGFVEIGRIPSGILDNGREIDDVMMVRQLRG
jgi:RimJ/RimL family protein N-acetyltransferase